MTKVISLSDDAYYMLKGLKGEGESFSDVVRRVAKKEGAKSIMDFAGIWKDYPEMDEIFDKILKDRERFKLRDVRF